MGRRLQHLQHRLTRQMTGDSQDEIERKDGDKIAATATTSAVGNDKKPLDAKNVVSAPLPTSTVAHYDGSPAHRTGVVSLCLVLDHSDFSEDFVYDPSRKSNGWSPCQLQKPLSETVVARTTETATDVGAADGVPKTFMSDGSSHEPLPPETLPFDEPRSPTSFDLTPDLALCRKPLPPQKICQSSPSSRITAVTMYPPIDESDDDDSPQVDPADNETHRSGSTTTTTTTDDDDDEDPAAKIDNLALSRLDSCPAYPAPIPPSNATSTLPRPPLPVPQLPSAATAESCRPQAVAGVGGGEGGGGGGAPLNRSGEMSCCRDSCPSAPAPPPPSVAKGHRSPSGPSQIYLQLVLSIDPETGSNDC